MADAPKTKPETKPEAPKTSLAPAGQSGEPEVQRLLAMREGHLQTAEAEPTDVEVRRQAARNAVAEIDKELAALGYSAS